MKRNILHFGVQQGKTHTYVHKHQYMRKHKYQHRHTDN